MPYTTERCPECGREYDPHDEPAQAHAAGCKLGAFAQEIVDDIAGQPLAKRQADAEAEAWKRHIRLGIHRLGEAIYELRIATLGDRPHPDEWVQAVAIAASEDLWQLASALQQLTDAETALTRHFPKL